MDYVHSKDIIGVKYGEINGYTEQSMDKIRGTI